MEEKKDNKNAEKKPQNKTKKTTKSSSKTGSGTKKSTGPKKTTKSSTTKTSTTNTKKKETGKPKVEENKKEETMVFKNKNKSINSKISDDTKMYIPTEENKEKVEDSKKYIGTDSKKDKEVKNLEKKIKKDGKKKKHPKLWLAIKIIIIIVLLIIIAGVAAFCAIFFSDNWSITKEQLLSDRGLKIVDLDGNEITSLTGDEITQKVSLDAMSKIPDAFIAIEDKRFYDHNGVDIIRTSSAILNYGMSIITKKNASFGGSTITQQLVKITMNDDERGGIEGIKRKIREWSRAMQVEDMLEKDQILERYLNRIYLGSSGGLEVRGVESAAKHYFNKSASELDAAQCAFLAGINHSPNIYNPFEEGNSHSEEIRKRTLTVLDLMHEQGKLSDEDYETAVTETNGGLPFEKGAISNGNSTLSYHTAAAINQVAEEISAKQDISYPEAREILINSGYTLYTTVNKSIQETAETEYKSGKYNRKVAGVQSAIAIIEPSTGYVVAGVGGLGEGLDTLGLNRINSARSAGSAFKPLVNIAPSLENGTIVASTLFDDSPTAFGGYSPSDDGGSSRGIMTIRTAIAWSKNIPEVKLLQLQGIDNACNFLSKIGITVDDIYKDLSLALGTQTVTPVQMAAAYAMIANGGVYITPTFYTKVVDQNGNTVIEAKQEKNRVMSEGNAYILTSILTGPIKQSGGTATAHANALGSMAVAGKTSTSSAAKDRWFCGFTPYYATACWYGYDNNEASVGSTNTAATIWFNVMKLIHKDLETKDFTKPDNIVSARICLDSGKRATDKCKNTYSEIFVKGTVPEECKGHTTVEICKETNKLATEFCPDKEERLFTEEIDTEKKGNWKTRSLKETTNPPKDTCDVHTKAEEIDVPNVVGKSQADAKKALEKEGFEVKILQNEDSSKKEGVVLKQSATKAPKGSTISITVNTYKGGGATDTNTIRNTTGNAITSNSNSTTTNKVKGD